MIYLAFFFLARARFTPSTTWHHITSLIVWLRPPPVANHPWPSSSPSPKPTNLSPSQVPWKTPVNHSIPLWQLKPHRSILQRTPQKVRPKYCGERRLNNQDRSFKARLTTISERGDRPLFFFPFLVFCAPKKGGVHSSNVRFSGSILTSR